MESVTNRGTVRLEGADWLYWQDVVSDTWRLSCQPLHGSSSDTLNTVFQKQVCEFYFSLTEHWAVCFFKPNQYDNLGSAPPGSINVLSLGFINLSNASHFSFIMKVD